MDHNKVDALHYYISQGLYLAVQSLVNEGVAFDMKDSYGKTPLMLAAEGSHIEIVKLLINSGADIDCCDDVGWTVLHYASFKGLVEIVQCLVKKDVALNMKDSGGKTPLMLAIDGLHREVIELLINSGADIDCCDDDGWTVLHYASFEGLVDIVQCLLKKDVALDMKDSGGKTSLMLAADGLHREIVELLINSGADIHCCDNIGWTMMHYASYAGFVEIVQCLLKKDAPLDMKDSYSTTPLMLAADWSHREIVELLINSGADIHCCDSDNGWTMLHHAAYRGWVEISQSLVNKGVAIDVKGRCNRTPLMVAARESNTEIVKLLINSAADIHCHDDRGETALHYASRGDTRTTEARRSHIEVLEVLINSGAIIHCCDNNGRTALHYVSSDGETADFLLKAGADCNLEDYEGKSAFNLLISEERPNVEIIKLFILKGAYVKSTDYNCLVEDPLLKEAILQDVRLCSQAVINKFNNRDLPMLYEKIPSAYKLPHIEKMKIGSRSGMVLEIEQTVTYEIQTKGFCSLLEIVPLVLGILCVKTYIENLIPAFN